MYIHIHVYVIRFSCSFIPNIPSAVHATPVRSRDGSLCLIICILCSSKMRHGFRMSPTDILRGDFSISMALPAPSDVWFLFGLVMVFGFFSSEIYFRVQKGTTLGVRVSFCWAAVVVIYCLLGGS